jgi:uncharacterized membrane protein YvlD (DUF360 family)
VRRRGEPVILDCSLRAVGIGCAAAVTPDLAIDDRLWTWVWLAVLFSIVNVLIGRPLRSLSVPLLVGTLGAVAIVVNAGLLELVDRMTPALTIATMGGVLIAAVIIAVTDIAGELVGRLLDA